MNREWLIANRNGSYSSSTISFANTRTYHGILVKNISQYYDRMVLLSKMFEVVYINKEFLLDSNYYPDVIYPDGYKYISKYRIFPIPYFEYALDNTIIKKSILIDPDMDNVFINYNITGEIPSKFKITPLISFRSFHSVIRKGMRSFKYSISGITNFEFEGLDLKISSPGSFIKNEDWYYNFQYPVEKERGTNFEEDLFMPGYFIIENPPKRFTLEISGEEISGKSFDEVKNRYLERLYESKKTFKNMEMASNFLITRDDIIAGYYWFGSWARDAFISIPGLLLLDGRYREAFNILSKYANSMINGIIPKTYSKSDDYITADTSLWFIYALYKYYMYTKSKEDLLKLYPYAKKIIESYIQGNEKFVLDRYFIRTKDAPLTWMDANYGGKPVTPRIGLPVEINALWYNALSTMEFFNRELNIKNEPDTVEIRLGLESAFENKFVMDGKMLDVSDPDDVSIRPNIIFAFSLPFPVMRGFGNYMDTIDSELLTPLGLRTLSPNDPKFRPKYQGDWYSRDMAYHNGSVWPWLAGPYITASLNSGKNPKKLFNYFKGLYKLTYLPEIYDGLEPVEPKGCILQAWSYGELLRAYYEDILPKMRK